MKGTSLHPIFETVVRRTTRKIKAQGSEIELALDDGEVRAAQASRDLREAELELKSGSAEGKMPLAFQVPAGLAGLPPYPSRPKHQK